MTALLDEVMAWVRGGTYAPDEAQLTDVIMADDARLLAQAFTGEDGRKRLMTFARLTVLRPPVNPGLPSGQREAYAQLRQGQDSIFAALVRYLDLHDANQRTTQNDRSNTDAGPDHAPGGPADPYAGSGGISDARLEDGGPLIGGR